MSNSQAVESFTKSASTAKSRIEGWLTRRSLRGKHYPVTTTSRHKENPILTKE